jgi:hypothetical protein
MGSCDRRRKPRGPLESLATLEVPEGLSQLTRADNVYLSNRLLPQCRVEQFASTQGFDSLCKGNLAGACP